MDLVIKDMDMPHDCDVCFCRNSDFCQLLNKECSRERYLHTRLEGCKLGVFTSKDLKSTKKD